MTEGNDEEAVIKQTFLSLIFKGISVFGCRYENTERTHRDE
jgi:hypothetical protein